MQENNFKALLNGTRNDLKIAVDDLFNVIEIVYEDMEHLQLKAFRPDKMAASLLLDYLGWEEGMSKQNLEKLCGKEIQQYMKWLEYYCKENGTTQEQALKEIINGEI